MQPLGRPADATTPPPPPRTVRLPGGLRHGSSVSTFRTVGAAAVRGGDAEDGEDADEGGGGGGGLALKSDDGDVQHLAFAGLTSLLVSASATSVQCWNVLSCSLVWSFSAHVISLAADRIGLATSSRVALTVYDAPDPLPAAAGALHAATPSGYRRAHLVLLDAESPVPIASWALPDTGVGSSVVMGALPPEARAPLFAAVFAPSLAAAAAAAAASSSTSSHAAPPPRTHDVLVLGPQNEIWRLPTAALIAAASTAAAGAADSAPMEHQGPPAGTASSATAPPPAVAFYPQGPRPSRAAALAGSIAAAGRGGPAPLEGSSSAHAPAAGAAVDGGGSSDLASLLRSAGPVQALVSSTYLYDALLGSMLPPAPPRPSAGGAGTDGPGASSTKRPRAAVAGGGGGGADPMVPPPAQASRLDAAFATAEAWGLGSFDVSLAPSQRRAASAAGAPGEAALDAATAGVAGGVSAALDSGTLSSAAMRAMSGLFTHSGGAAAAAGAAPPARPLAAEADDGAKSARKRARVADVSSRSAPAAAPAATAPAAAAPAAASPAAAPSHAVPPAVHAAAASSVAALASPALSQRQTRSRSRADSLSSNPDQADTAAAPAPAFLPRLPAVPEDAPASPADSAAITGSSAGNKTSSKTPHSLSRRVASKKGR